MGKSPDTNFKCEAMQVGLGEGSIYCAPATNPYIRTCRPCSTFMTAASESIDERPI